jgi:hypothetical protein
VAGNFVNNEITPFFNRLEAVFKVFATGFFGEGGDRDGGMSAV